MLFALIIIITSSIIVNIAGSTTPVGYCDGIKVDGSNETQCLTGDIILEGKQYIKIESHTLKKYKYEPPLIS
jgi:hypothetical protein